MDEVTQETGDQAALTEEQGVNELLERWKVKPAAEKVETRHDEGQEEGGEQRAEVEQPEGDAEADDAFEQPGEIEIDVGGAKFKAPAAVAETFKQVEAKVKEIEAGATRKFQEAADLRKANEIERQALAQLQKVAMENADLLADHRMVARRMQQLEAVDVQNTEPDVLTRLNAEYNQLQATRTRIEHQYGQNVQKMRDEEGKALQAKLEHADRLLSSQIKGWGPERQKQLAEYAVSRGAPADALKSVTEAWMVAILDDAAYGHAMRTRKPTDKRVTEPVKTLAPGASGAKSATVAKADAAMKQFKKSGSLDDAVTALLARSHTRRK